jgi:acetyl-CoA carboxylase alpha subunit
LRYMTVTPMPTLIRGIDQFIADPRITGAVAEIHGDKVTIRQHQEYVDKESEKNIETFWNLGYA